MADHSGGGGAGSAPPQQPLPPLPFFDDAWQLKARPAPFEGMIAANDVLGLNVMRDMTGARAVHVVREGSGASGAYGGVAPSAAEGLRRYLAGVAYLIQHEGLRPELEFEWSSPLSGRPNRFFRVGGLDKELALATFLYGALLRQLGLQGVWDLLGLPPGSSGGGGGGSSSPAGAAAGAGGGKALPAPGSEEAAAALAAAVTQLRQAAGVFEHLATSQLPPLQADLRGDRPGELSPTLAAALAQTCLAEAQAVTAFRAAAKPGSSAAVAAALQAGAAELFEKATKTLRAHSGDYPIASERLRRYLAIGAGLATARAHASMAGEHHRALRAGAGARACAEAERLLGAAAGAADLDAGWRALLQREAARVAALKAPIESDRLVVTCEPLPHDAPPLPLPKVLVAALVFAAPEAAAGTAAEIALAR